MASIIRKIVGTAQDRMLKRYRKIVADVNRWDEQFKSLSDDELKGKTDEFKRRIQEGESVDDLLPEAYATVKNICRRLYGTDIHVSGYDQKWDMVPYDVQVLGAISMHYGSIAEMKTGEGKTLTASMPLYLNAMTGKPVHLVTVNDYLCQRDCEWTGSILRWAGLTTGVLTNDVPTSERGDIYSNDVVYGTASEFGFDYLRDNSMVFRKEDQVQRGYYFAIVDEIDSILIDEARTPLIISGPAPVSRQMYDDLKGGIDGLVKQQRDLCNQLANDARKKLDSLGLLGEEEVKLSKSEEQEAKDALTNLWITSKGTPHSKILKRVRENPHLRAELDKIDVYFHGEQSKDEKTRTLAPLLITVDERASEFELTDKGISEWERGGHGSADDFIMLDLGYEYHKIDEDASLDEEQKLEKKIAAREEDSLRKERAHNLRQLLRAHLLMERDVDYIIQDRKIVIIDENTGRPQPGRRFSDGLHSAIEAKEAVPVQKETQTYATITLQNYFRMYDKLSGMTGTAGTEAGEFKEIYQLDVLEIPTYKKCQRKDAHDLVFMTEREKYNAILEEVRKVHGEGRPILLGTESVDVSEKLARIFRVNKLPHTVLNAKYHGKEAEIIASAGQRGAIVIATNMAGRGTDIKLSEGVADLGGLHVIGASRHQSRRIDRQLRGRSARLGDPGSSVFFVSFEDSLMRLFASPRINTVLKRLRPPEGEPITGGMLTRTIESAQKRVEGSNYMMRKHTLEYDDVMNKQRQEIYSFRNEVLHTEEIGALAKELLEEVCASMADQYGSGNNWDSEGYRQWLMTNFPVTFDDESEDRDQQTFIEEAIRKVEEAFDQKLIVEEAKVREQASKEVDAAAIPIRAIRSLMIRTIDQLWQEHLLTMDHLRSDVGLRAIAQKDPLLEFKHDAFALFGELGHTLQTKIASSLFLFEIVPQTRNEMEDILNKVQLETSRSLAPGDSQQPSLVQQSLQNQAQQQPPPAEPVETGPKVGRNDLCPCGSGKKYKKCCGVNEVSLQEPLVN